MIGLLSAAAVVLAPPVEAATVAGTDVTYTTDANFDNGTLVNVNHDAPNNNQLQLNTTTGTFPFIWVALSQRCTIAKINTVTGAILGEYRTLSDGTGCTESSRTTVSLDGSVWVGHRGPGGITHVGLVELNECVDRNGNSVIDTSTGYGDVKPWPGVNAAVSAAEDECILHHVNFGGGDSRHMSVDSAGNVWVGDRNGGSIFRKFDGATAALLAGPFDFNCGGYGGLIDGNGVIWSATSGGSILRYDTTAPISGTNPTCLPYNNYGMAIDSLGNVWVSTLGEGVVRKFAPSGALLGAFPQGNANAQGLAVGNNDDVWISSSLFCGGGCNVAHLRNDGSLVGNVPTPTGSGSTGVSVDAAGKVWTANRSSNTAVRINPAAGPVIGGTPLGAVDLTVNFPAGPGGRPLPYPYNYSDMTGQQLFSSTSPQGTWTVTQDAGVAGTDWGKVTWNTEPQGSEPSGTSILVEARAADSEAALGSQSYAAVANATTFSLLGRFIQVRATLKPNATGTSPVLSDIRIQTSTPPPDLSVTKTASPSPATVGQPLTYTLTVANAPGHLNATGVVVTDTLPAGVTFNSAVPSQGSCSQAAGVVTCNLGSLASGASATITIVVTPTVAGTVTNTASVDGDQADTDPSNDTTSVTTTVNASADLRITKTASPSPVLAGQNLTYTLTASNLGPSPATGVVVNDTLPAGVSFVSATPSQGSCTQAAGTVTCNLGNLANGASATITIVVTPAQAGTLTNTATLSGGQNDPVPGNNTATSTTTVNPAANLSITKTAAPNPVLVGGNLVYTITVANAGPSPATGVVVSDTLPANVAYVSSTASQGSCVQAAGVVTCNLGTLASGASATVTITVRPTAKNLNTTNRATVRANEADPVQANNTGGVTSSVLLAEGSAFGVKLSALFINLGPTPSVFRNTPGTSSTFLASVVSGGLLNAQGLAVQTQIGPGTTVNSSAETASANLVNSLVAANVIRATCSASTTSRTGATTIDKLVLASGTLSNITPAPNTTIPLVVGSLVLNEQIVTADGITVNAIHLRVPLLGVDVIVSQARCVVDP